MTTILCISHASLRSYAEQIQELAERIYGDAASVSFNEKYIPPAGRVPGQGADRVARFCSFLQHVPRCLVIIYEDGKCCGFILLSDNPFNNSVGFGIHPLFARKGIMSRAWQLLQEQCTCFVFPLYGYTSQLNTPARTFMERHGFQLLDSNIYFGGEPSCQYVCAGIRRFPDVTDTRQGEGRD